MSLIVSLVLLMGLVAMPAEAQVQRVIFASAGFDETNRFWVISRPNQLQNDPCLETLLDLDAKTGAFIPRLAEKWEANADMTEWTLYLRKGVPFHFGYGEFTARDVVHSHSLMLREETVATFVGMWRNVAEVQVISGALTHLFESAFVEQKYAELTRTLDPQARERVAREITDHLFDEFTSIPLLTVFHEVAVNPKVIAGWTWPGQGAGRTTHFDLIKAAP
jgi:ABC-type transport system substrate-binding protein